MRIEKDHMGIEWAVYSPRYVPFVASNIAVATAVYFVSKSGHSETYDPILGLVGILTLVGCAIWLLKNVEYQAAWLEAFFGRWRSGCVHVRMRGIEIWMRKK